MVACKATSLRPIRFLKPDRSVGKNLSGADLKRSSTIHSARFGLEQLEIKNISHGEIYKKEAAGICIFIGAKYFTDWLVHEIITNDRGFIETDLNLQDYEDYKKIWKLERDPYLLETSCAGIFAAGDVRAGAMNRVASAVGEGSMAISFVHKYLGEM